MEREFYDGECLNGESGGGFHYDTIQTTQAMLRGQEVNIEYSSRKQPKDMEVGPWKNSSG